MGVGIYLKGEIPHDGKLKRAEARGWLERAGAWFGRHAEGVLLGRRPGRHDGKWPALLLRLHPAAEEAELWLTASGRLTVSATTSPVGPGYHVYLCDLLRGLGEELGVTWHPPDEDRGGGDETGYFHGADASAVEDEMLLWIHTVVGQVLGLPEGHIAVRIAMPLDCEYDAPGATVTPLGPRALAWLKAVAADRRRAIDFFPWWLAGLGAEFYLGRALSRMWNEVRWRPPLEEDDDEEDLLVDVLNDLARAHALDPGLNYPWREWHELLGYLVEAYGDTSLLEDEGEAIPAEVARRTAEAPEGPRIGYRRGPVRVSLGGGWQITVPGEFAEEWDEDDVWVGWDGRRTVRFKGYRFEGDDVPSAAALLDMGERHWDAEGCEPLPDHADGPLRGRAIWGPYEEDGRRMWKVNAYSATEGNLALCNCYFHDPADREWALTTWHSLTHPGPRSRE